MDTLLCQFVCNARIVAKQYDLLENCLNSYAK